MFFKKIWLALKEAETKAASLFTLLTEEQRRTQQNFRKINSIEDRMLKMESKMK